MVNSDGTLASSGSTQYTYDAMQQRVQKVGGSNPGEFVYFGGHPVAVLDPQTGVWTDLIYLGDHWAGDNLIAEAGPNQQSFSYRLLDHLGSPAVTTDASGNVTGTADYAPYGPVLASSTSDPYLYTGLYQDTEYGGYHAWHRNESAEQIRWLTPDPYNGSYDLMNPQSLNRYAYLNGNPLDDSDPSGLAGAGVLTGVGGAPCKAFGANIPIGDNLGLNPCNPVGSAITDAITLVAAYAEAYRTGKDISSIISGWKKSFNPDAAKGYDSTFSGIAASVGAAITIACSIDSNSDLCGQTGWTGALIGGTAGKVVGDSIAVAGAAACFAGPEACLGYAIYTIANDVFAAIWDALGLGPPKFKGSLLPRPSDLGGLGTAPIGIPNQNLRVQQLLGSAPKSEVPSPGMVHP